MSLFDKFFFSREIPKNYIKYWFFHFAAYSKSRMPIQLMLVIFASRKRRFKLEYYGKGIELKSTNHYIIAGWIFDNKIIRLPPQSVFVNFNGKIKSVSKGLYLSLKNKGGTLELEASYLGYNIFLSTLKKINSKKGDYDSAFNNTVSGLSQNFITRADINGKKFKGNLFIQSLQSWIAIPWNWCRIAFSDKSNLGLSAFYFLTKNLRVLSTLEFYNAAEKKLYKFSIKKMHFSNGVWFIEARNGENSLYLKLKTLSVEKFQFKTFTTFDYHEHLVYVEEILFEVKGKTKDVKDLGVGSGILEDTKGLLL